MVSKRELLKQLEEDDKSKAAQEEKAKRSHQQWVREYNRKNLERVETLVDGELGEVLKRHRKLRTILLDDNRVWEANQHKGDSRHEPSVHGNELYGEEFDLGFTPEPNYEPTKRLLELLNAAGFKAEVVSQREPDIVFNGTDDGYGMERTGTYHTAYYLQISW